MTRPLRLDGSGRTDRLMATLTGVVAVYRRLSGVSGRRRPPVLAVDRDLPLVVDDVRAEAEGVVSLRLVPERGEVLPRWRPGAHVDLSPRPGLVRQYSLCGDPDDRSVYRVGVRLLGEGSTAVHGLKKGARVTVRGPRNAFPFVASPSYLFVAGGIGITPILPMVRQAAASGADWRLVYTGRDRASMPFLEELAQIEALFPAESSSTLSGDRVWIRPDTEYGVPASGAELLEGMPEQAPIYCCGPVPMIVGVRADAALRTSGPVFFERFSPPPIVGGEPFRVTLARSGVTLDVPADRTTLDVLRETVPGIAYSCRQGFCGTCELPTVTGARVRVCVEREPVTLDL
ncbi:PDR/VanB family oxidoreductase [Amycolatopsis regifaucium]|uniref:Phthalate 4,5-dioxygenase n=1 Tax=Amycolatopsis regifaucium TaxID=546365 RepID=A0A154ML41_9PSEU|nr:oxidoreductase [Amycolatopsis regifaucium]KZB85104.1 phthalate 4,5-dioxygenase [Amycolatopsis regifaucium]OKA04128.1 phthalate 4,5-dioxygenase [Amycolatopsis regifaucium]SFH93839.1 Ferredoxin-NADP reductase [Amycolatopsis regifaucium]